MNFFKTSSIKSRIISLIVGFVVILMWVTLGLMNSSTQKLQNEASKTVETLDGNAKESVKSDIEELASNIAYHISSVEKEIDKNMLNSAYYLQEMDKHNKHLTNEDLDKLADKMYMTDLYLTDEVGNFKVSTERASLGANLVKFVGIYQNILDDKMPIIDGPLMMKQETGEIFKFTAIPRINEEGKTVGIVESAFSAEQIEKALKEYIKEGNGVKALYMFDNSKLVLTETLGEGQKSLWEKGKTLEKSDMVEKVFKENKPVFTLKENEADIYVPVKRGEQTAYVLYALIDTKPYFANSVVTKNALENITQTLKDSSYQVIITNTIVAGILLAIIVFFINSALKPLHNFAQILRQLGKNKEGVPVIGEQSKELKDIHEATIEVVEHYEDLIKVIQSSTDAVAVVQQKYSDEMEITSRSLNEVAKAVNETASNNQHQIQHVDEAKRIMTTMNQSLNEVSNMTEQLGTTATKSGKITETSVQGLDSMTKAINNIHDEVRFSSNRVDSLIQRSNEIGGIIGLIQGIAEQTNLLSLNASIEAARAGEHGRGFAVVANEVRTLAEESKKATEKIAQILSDIQTGIHETKVSNDNQITVIENSQKEVKQVISTFGELISATQHSSDQINKLFQFVKNLSGSGKDVTQIFEKLNYSIESNAANSEELLASVEEVTSSLDQLRNLLHQLNDSTNNLTQLMK